MTDAWFAAGIPVRCFQVDNAINDLLGINPMSPSAKGERKRKQAQWDDIQGTVVQVRAPKVDVLL